MRSSVVFKVVPFVLLPLTACGRSATTPPSPPTSSASQLKPEPKDRVEKAVAKFDADVEKIRAKFQAPRDDAPASVAKELAHMVEVDQFMRESMSIPFEEGLSAAEATRFQQLFGSRMRAIDEHNTERVRQLVGKHGWFRISVFGEDADNHGWLLVQHADHDIAFQKRILGMLEPLLATKDTSPGNYAYLYDRIAAHEHREQRYATQGHCTGPGTWRPDPVEDPAHVDERRNAAGLRPFADYLKGFATLCHKAD